MLLLAFHRAVADEVAVDPTLLLLVAERQARRESGIEMLIEAAIRIKMPPAPTKKIVMMLREKRKRTTAETMATEKMTEPGEDLRATKVVAKLDQDAQALKHIRLENKLIF